MLQSRMTDYITAEKSRLAAKTKRIEKLRVSGRPVYVWGIGREFLYLYETANLKQCRIDGFIDANPFKRHTVTIRGMPVVGPGVLARAPENAVLVITAVAHVEAIARSATEAGFRGEVFDL